MAHFAELDKDNTVLRVLVIDNDVVHDENGLEVEELGIAFCKKLFGEDTNWVQTSYNHNFRGQFAGIGDVYDKENNVFVASGPRMVFETSLKDVEITK
jgi:hypothetical protein